MLVNGDIEITGDTTTTGDFITIPSGSKVYLDGGGDTYISEYAANSIGVYAGGILALSFFSAYIQSTLDFVVNTTKKLYLDGGTDTYIIESSDNVIDIYANSNKLISFDGTNSLISVNTGINFTLAATKKLYLDGGTDTYISETSANIIGLYTAGTMALQASSTLVNIGSRDFAVTAAKKLYLDGGGDTYIYESSANNINIYTGGTSRFFISSSLVGCSAGMDLSIDATQKLYLDGGTDTYISESGANIISITTGGGVRATFSSSGNTISSNTAFDTNVLYVDATNNKVYIGATSATSTGGTTAPVLQLTASTAAANISLINTATGNTGAGLYTLHSTTSPADGDGVFVHRCYGMDDGSAEQQYALFTVVAEDVSAGTEDGAYEITLASGGSLSGTPTISISKTSGIVVNTDITPVSPGSWDIGNGSSFDFDNMYANAYNVTSDIRLKQNIKPLDLGLDFIKKLNPVTFQWKEARQNVYEKKIKKIKDKETGKIVEKEVEKKIKVIKTDEEKRYHTGFIAQEFEKALDGRDLAVICRDKKSDKYSMRYDEVVPFCVKAIQELSDQIEELKKQLNPKKKGN